MNDATSGLAPETNPFASPLAEDAPVEVAPSDVENERRRLLNHEASVKSIGSLYLLGSILYGLGVSSAMFGLMAIGAGPAEIAVYVGMLGLAVLLFFVGRGLRSLSKWARVPAIVLSVIGLIGFPIGTLINLYFLYVLGSKKGADVFSPAYAEVIAATPHIRYRTSIVVKVLLAILVIVLVLGFASLFFAL
ncbi:MAG: hypothetical protein AAGJ46_07320 [Planctomycetota bacterium]